MTPGTAQSRPDVTYRQVRGAPVGAPLLLSAASAIPPVEKPTLTTYQCRVAEAIRWNVEQLCARVGESRVGFVTLTFANPAPTIEQAQERFRKLRRGFLNGYSRHDWVGVCERSPLKKRLHYHLVTACPTDIAAGFDWERYDAGLTSGLTSNGALVRQWAEWREACRSYGFGMPFGPHPLRKAPGAIAWYLAGYLAKAVLRREVSDVHHKILLAGRSARRSTVHTASADSPGAIHWRKQLKAWSHVLFGPSGCEADWKKAFGRYWAFACREEIFRFDPITLEPVEPFRGDESKDFEQLRLTAGTESELTRVSKGGADAATVSASRIPTPPAPLGSIVPRARDCQGRTPRAASPP